MPFMVVIFVTIAWVAGILLGNHLEPGFAVMLPIIAFGVAMLLFFRQEAGWRVFFAAVLFLGLGMLRFDEARPTTNDQHISQLNDQGRTTVIGRIIAEPETLDDTTRILIETEEAAGRPYNGRVLVRVPPDSDVHYGDEVRLFGTLRTPPNFDTFDYQDYLARQEVFSLMPNASVTVTATDQGNPAFARLLEVKDQARTFIEDNLSHPESALLVGILLGDETGITGEVEEAFIATGTAHVVAISGFNMVILAQLVMSMLRQLMPERRAVFFGLIAIAVYTIFVGAGAAVVRAAFMSGLLIISQAMTRKTFVPTSLALTALVMSAYNPWVLWDIGFQLSFAAILGMSLFVEPFEKATFTFLNRFTDENNARRGLKLLSEPLIVTAAAQVTTIPLTLLYFGRLPLLSLVVNFLITPVQTPLLLFGALSVLVGLLLPAVGIILLDITWFFLAWTIEVVLVFGGIEWADVALSLDAGIVVLIFVALTTVILYQATRPRWAMRLVAQIERQSAVVALSMAGLLVSGLLMIDIMQRPDGNLHVTFLDVGAQNGVLIETPQGGVILIDGGNQPSQLLEALGNYLPNRAERIDVVVITAPTQPDNYTALMEVTDRYEVGVLVTNGQETSETNTLFSQLDGVPHVAVTAGYRLETQDGVAIEVLHPDETPRNDTAATEAALVLRLTYGDASFLFTSEIESPVEEILLANPHLVQSTVLQVPAHGDDDASSGRFISVNNAQVAVIQTELTASPIVLSRLEATRIFRTDNHGAVEVISDGQRIWIQTED